MHQTHKSADNRAATGSACQKLRAPLQSSHVAGGHRASPEYWGRQKSHRCAAWPNPAAAARHKLVHRRRWRRPRASPPGHRPRQSSPDPSWLFSPCVPATRRLPPCVPFRQAGRLPTALPRPREPAAYRARPDPRPRIPQTVEVDRRAVYEPSRFRCHPRPQLASPAARMSR